MKREQLIARLAMLDALDEVEALATSRGLSVRREDGANGMRVSVKPPQRRAEGMAAARLRGVLAKVRAVHGLNSAEAIAANLTQGDVLMSGGVGRVSLGMVEAHLAVLGLRLRTNDEARAQRPWSGSYRSRPH